MHGILMTEKTEKKLGIKNQPCDIKKANAIYLIRRYLGHLQKALNYSLILYF